MDRYLSYTAQNQVSFETTHLKRDDNTTSKTQTDYTFYTSFTAGQDNSANYLLGSVNQTNTQNWDTWAGSGGANSSSSITNSYNWHSGAVLKSITNDKDGDGTVDYTTTMTLGKDGTLQRANISDGTPRVVTYSNDGGGQVLKRDEAINANTTAPAPHDIHYRFGGKTMGKVSNNGTNDVAYETSVVDRTDSDNNTGPFRNGDTYASPHADFDQFYNPVNSYQQSASGGAYTVRSGDTLSGIASGLYGDSSLWFKIAEANGLSGNAQLVEGTTLRLPSGVQKNTHNATTFQPYDPADAVGDVSPTTPEPPKDNKCGVMGQILLVVVAVAIQFIPVVGQIATAVGGAIGSAVGAVAGSTIGSAVGAFASGAVSGAISSAGSQGVGVATGIQDKFSWKAVGQAALSGGLGGPNSGGVSSVRDAAIEFARGAAGSAISQGIGVAIGLQDKFSWTGVAAAGAGNAFGGYIDTKFGGKIEGATNHRVRGVVKSSASAIANAATRSAIDGTNFGDGLVAAIPDVIGQAMGSALGESVFGALEPREGPLDFIFDFVSDVTGGVYDRVVTVGNVISDNISYSASGGVSFNFQAAISDTVGLVAGLPHGITDGLADMYANARAYNTAKAAALPAIASPAITAPPAPDGSKFVSKDVDEIISRGVRKSKGSNLGLIMDNFFKETDPNRPRPDVVAQIRDLNSMTVGKYLTMKHFLSIEGAYDGGQFALRDGPVLDVIGVPHDLLNIKGLMAPQSDAGYAMMGVYPDGSFVPAHIYGIDGEKISFTGDKYRLLVGAFLEIEAVLAEYSILSEAPTVVAKSIDTIGDAARAGRRYLDGVDNIPINHRFIGELMPPPKSVARSPGDDILVTAENGLQSRKIGRFSDVNIGKYSDDATRYLYTVDQRGVNIVLENSPLHYANKGKLKHTNLSDKAAIGGEVWFTGKKSVTINMGSGRFGDGAGRTLAQWTATVDVWKQLGYNVNAIKYGKR